MTAPPLRPTSEPSGPGAAMRLRVAAGVAWRDGRVLLTQRPPGGPLGLLWEFPGGKIEAGETPERALIREIEEELGVGARPLGILGVHRHAYRDGPEVEITFVGCELESSAFTPSSAVHAVRWVKPNEVDLSEVLAGDHEFMRALAAREDGNGSAGRP